MYKTSSTEGVFVQIMEIELVNANVGCRLFRNEGGDGSGEEVVDSSYIYSKLIY
jgi:hypothetical protein